MTVSGTIKLQNLYQWMKVRKALEMQPKTGSEDPNEINNHRIIECPGSNDVIVSSRNR